MSAHHALNRTSCALNRTSRPLNRTYLKLGPEPGRTRSEKFFFIDFLYYVLPNTAVRAVQAVQCGSKAYEEGANGFQCGSDVRFSRFLVGGANGNAALR